MLDFLELEETVGRAWHRLVGATASYPRSSRAGGDAGRGAAAQLAVMFRALGGEAGVQLAGASARKSGHRLGWRQRIGLGEERLDQPGRDAATRVPAGPDRAVSRSRAQRALYLWLAAWFAIVPVATIAETDPLRRDLLMLRRARDTVAAVLARFPGPGRPYARLAAAVATARPRRPLPRTEREVERIVLALLGAGRAARRRAVVGRDRRPARCRRRRRRTISRCLPCPLWGDCWTRDVARRARRRRRALAGPAAPRPPDTRKRFAVRERDDDASQRDPFVLNRFEKILAMAEMVNVDRPSDDSEDEDAARPPTISTSSRSAAAAASRRPSSNSISTCRRRRSTPRGSTAGRLYPEWDYRSGAYLPDHCRVLAAHAPETGEAWAPDESHAPPYPAGAAAVRGAAAAPRGAARPAGRPRSRPRRAGARALRSARRQRRARSGPSRDATAGARSRGDAAGRRLALDRRLGRRPPRSRRREGGAARARPRAVGLRRPPQHSHLHLAPARPGCASRPSRRSASRWARRWSGASARSSPATTRASARRSAMPRPNSRGSRSARSCCWC